jgi:parvulin-like peptidyl-prolyl isomerase
MVSPFSSEARARAVEIDTGSLSKPIEVPDGLLVFRVTDREGFDPASFEKQRDQLTRSLLQQRRDRLFNAVVQRLEKDADIKINQPRLDAIEGRGAST